MPRPSVHIIDDDEDICCEISSALLASGYDCSWATCVDRADRPDKPAPDILLLDLNMPNLDGFQIIRKIADEQHKPHVIVASGHEQRIIDAAVRYAREVGLNVLGSLGKPYSVASLLTLVEGSAISAPKAPCSQTAFVRELARTDALERHMKTAFQSKRRLSDGAIVGYEALLRMTIGNLSISPETIFEPGVELETQLALTQMVLDDALRFGSILRGAGTPATVSVNCTPAIFCAPELPDMVFDALDRWEMPANSLTIEITEHPTGQSCDAVTTAACRLAMRGCGISIDDFGRGTTSLERLFDLPLTELKIDKEIFWKCNDGREPSRLLKEVVSYCDDRNISSVIEGIETTEHLAHAALLGARLGQGYLWDRPATDDRVVGHRSQARSAQVAPP